jgi:hypothetical protein
MADQRHVSNGDRQDNQNAQNLQNAQNVQNNDQAAQINVPAGAPGTAQTTLAFKVDQSKIPEFYGQKGKDKLWQSCLSEKMMT